jgi:hypothetical protein
MRFFYALQILMATAAIAMPDPAPADVAAALTRKAEGKICVPASCIGNVSYLKDVF